jgi:hypothetical protein
VAGGVQTNLSWRKDLQLLPALSRIGALPAVGAQYLAVNAQPPVSYLRTSFTDREGLSSNIINAIVQTGDGTLWVGTGNSLDRFDGHGFSHLQTRAARALAVGRDGDLWAATLLMSAHSPVISSRSGSVVRMTAPSSCLRSVNTGT